MVRKISKILRTFCTIICTFLAIHMVFQQVLRFQRDEDISSISYRQFNSNPIDLYPTITFCFSRVQLFFVGCYTGIYLQHLLNEKFGIHNCKFEKILSGKNTVQKSLTSAKFCL